MKTVPHTVSYFGVSIASYKLNAFFGIFGIYLLCIFLTWYLTGIFSIPLPDDVALRSLTTVTIQAVFMIVIPYLWAIKRLNFSLPELGISTNKLIPSIILGCALYSIALAAFIHCSADPFVSNHAIGKTDTGDTLILLLAMSIGAASTDITTRGFILFTLKRYTNLPIAIFMQNVAWFAGHVEEIDMLTNCLGFWGAAGLTLTLGLLGDVIALKTRNIVGLSIAHVLLNVILTFYIKSL